MEVTSKASPSILAAASLGMGALSAYLFLRSKTETPIEDLKELMTLIKCKRQADSKINSDWSVADSFEETVSKNAKKPCLVFANNNESFTFKQVNEKVNQVANWAASNGFKEGDIVALLMDNRPEFLFTWIGLAKIGVCCALINTYLSGKPLIHSLSVCGATKAIIGSEHGKKVNEIKSQITVNYSWYTIGNVSVPNMISIDKQLSSQPTKNPSRSLRKNTNSKSNLFLIYTSGTTGFPKASVIKHIRFYIGAMASSELYHIQNTDKLYCCLPLYHSAGGIIGVGCMIYSGCTFVFRKKFSASKFWEDIHNYRCTAFQYIGELCRYLLSQPETKFDKDHTIRIAVGNGMRPDVWLPFQKRFNVPKIGEFYGATEGNCNMTNGRGKFAAVGYISPLYAFIFPIKLVRFDIEKEEPIRNKDGFCILCKPGESGELLGYIDPNDPLRAFDGYTDKKATSKKILRDVFKKGDAWFRSGDLLKQDSSGFYYFVDRIGDTFRWKGENVSTGEVAEVLSSVNGVQEANVYGTEVPGHDGKAGMACIVVNSDFDFSDFFKITKAQLPPYAVPLFLRIQTEIEITSTFKHKKTDLKKEGFNPTKISDKLYFRDFDAGKYIPLDETLFNEIVSGSRARL